MTNSEVGNITNAFTYWAPARNPGVRGALACALCITLIIVAVTSRSVFNSLSGAVIQVRAEPPIDIALPNGKAPKLKRHSTLQYHRSFYFRRRSYFTLKSGGEFNLLTFNWISGPQKENVICNSIYCSRCISASYPLNTSDSSRT